MKRDRFPKAFVCCFQPDTAVSRIRRTPPPPPPHRILRAALPLFALLSTAVFHSAGFGANGSSPRRRSTGRFHIEPTRIPRPHPAGRLSAKFWLDAPPAADMRMPFRVSSIGCRHLAADVRVEGERYSHCPSA